MHTQSMRSSSKATSSKKRRKAKKEKGIKAKNKVKNEKVAKSERRDRKRRRGDGSPAKKRSRSEASSSQGAPDTKGSRAAPAPESEIPLFCGVCHNILRMPDQRMRLRCSHCDRAVQLAEGEHLVSVTRSSGLDVDKDVSFAGGNGAEHPIVDETCPKCGHTGLKFYTRQMRSVDEGSTVFYECPQCNFTYSEDN